jgi:hypothetical protein
MTASGTMPVAASPPLRQRRSCRPQKPQRRAMNRRPNAAKIGSAYLKQATNGYRTPDHQVSRRLKFITRNLTVMAKCIPISDL